MAAVPHATTFVGLPLVILLNVVEQLTLPDPWTGTSDTLPDFLNLGSTCRALHNTLDAHQTIWRDHEYSFSGPAHMQSFVDWLPTTQFQALRHIRLRNIRDWNSFDVRAFEALTTNHQLTLTIDITDDLSENVPQGMLPDPNDDPAWAPTRTLEHSILKLHEVRFALRQLYCVRIGYYSEPSLHDSTLPDTRDKDKLREEVRELRIILDTVLDQSCGILLSRDVNGRLRVNCTIFGERPPEEDNQQQQLSDDVD